MKNFVKIIMVVTIFCIIMPMSIFASVKYNPTDFTMAYLPNSNFTKTDLTGAAFNGAYLERANFYRATGTDFTGADVCDAILPDGSKGKCYYLANK
jgi:uncharacterized protein YjbI with pentapeptide repeats